MKLRRIALVGLAVVMAFGLMLGLSGCGFIIPIRGNGNVVSVYVPLNGTFDEIVVGGSFNVVVSSQASNRAILHVEENLARFVQVELQGNTLRVSQPINTSIRPTRPVEIHIGTEMLRGVRVTGSGSVMGEGQFEADNFRGSVSGSGSAELSFGDVNMLDISITGSGRLDLAGGIAERANVTVSGSGRADIDFDITDTLDLRITGSGDVMFEDGIADQANISVSGSGTANLRRLVTQAAYVRVTGSGDVFITLEESLNGSIAGSGDVTYFGYIDDANVDVRTTGSGRVRRGRS